MRLPLPTDLNTRDGTLTKDARLVNAFVDDSSVFKRPAVNTATVTYTGIAQGGLWFNNHAYTVNGDVLSVL